LFGKVSLTTNTDSPSPSKRGSKKRSKKSFDKRSPRKIQFLDVDPKLLAKQICIFDHKMLVKVAPSELFQSNWTKGKGENLSAIRERNTAVRQILVGYNRGPTTLLTNNLALSVGPMGCI
jgi:hypothetical protein